MPTQYVIQKNTSGNFSVYYRQFHSPRDLRARYEHYMAQGYSKPDALAEISALNDTFLRCNEKPEGYPIKQCEEYVMSYIQPGDNMVVEGRTFVVNNNGVA